MSTEDAKMTDATAAAEGTPGKDVKKEAEAVLSPNAASLSAPNDRDLIFGDVALEGQHKANLLLEDLIALHQIIWKGSSQDAAPPKKEADVEAVTDHLFQLMKKGKGQDLAGMKDVPTPFLVGAGRFLQKDSEWKELSDEDAKKLLKTKIFAALSKEDADDSANLKELRKEFAEFLAEQEKEATEEAVEPTPTDVIFLQRSYTDSDKTFNNQTGNKTIFALASQYVNAEVTTASERLEAALSVFLTKQPVDGDPAVAAASAAVTAATTSTDSAKVKEEAGKGKPRFVVCEPGENERRVYSLAKPADAAEVITIFVHEVWMEKEKLAAKRDISGGFDASDSATLDYPKPSTDPVDAPTVHDVLFGRGGMTNSHIGNKRFRDVIALHRPDIKAIKNDKPNVARRIVRAIRTSSPPGRFLKKSEDGKWRDVGDKVAAEKASQALREKSNTEKRARASQRESMRSKDGSLPAAPAAKKAKTSEVSISSPLLTASKLNYVGAPSTATTVVADGAKKSTKDGKEELKTEGLPPNAVDKDGNVLVTDWDILAGRGGLTNHHRGNKRFRDIVALHRPDYIRAPKVQKPSVARVIVRAIRNGDPPGRFLKKDEKSGKWYDIGDKRAAEKTSQALREKGGDGKEGAPPTPTAGAAATTAAGDDKNASFLLPALPKLEIGAAAAAAADVPVKVDDKGEAPPTPTAGATATTAAGDEKTEATPAEETKATTEESAKEGTKPEEEAGVVVV